MCSLLPWRQALAALLLALAGVSALAGTTASFTFRAKDYPGSRDREYKVYRPDNLDGAAPMLMALHGCRQTEDEVLRDWGLTAAADRFGFILVTPRITSYDGLRNPNCWGFWFDQHRHQGGGEPEDLHRIAQEVEGRFEVDPARRYITGLSSGAAMAVVAATTHNEYWAAAAAVAGLPYGEDAAAVSLSGQCPGSASFHAVGRVVADMRAELDDPYPIPLLVYRTTATARWSSPPAAICATPICRSSAPLPTIRRRPRSRARPPVRRPRSRIAPCLRALVWPAPLTVSCIAPACAPACLALTTRG